MATEASGALSFRWDFSKLDKFERTGSGALRIPAYLSRTGVFTYQNSDGSTRKELRTPEVVFEDASLKTIADIPVTEGHQAVVNTQNHRTLAVGHVGSDVRRDGDKIAATLVINDAATIAKIETGALREISLGYEVDLKEEKGNFDGEEYTHKQLNPRYNHAALGCAGFGRAGRDVGLRLDGTTYQLIPDVYTDAGSRTPNGKLSVMDLESLQKEITTLRQDAKEVADLKAAHEKTKGENEALKAQVATLTAQADPKRLDAAVAASLDIREKAMQATGKAVKGTDREVMVATIQAKASTFRADGLSDDGIKAAFELALAMPAAGLATVQPGAAAAVPTEERNDCEDAQIRMLERNKKAWK